MVFMRIGAGLLLGITIPFICHENIYLTIASTLLHPHIKYMQVVKNRDARHATST